MVSSTACAFVFAACLAQAWAGPYAGNYNSYGSGNGNSQWNNWQTQASAQGQVEVSMVTQTMTETTTCTETTTMKEVMTQTMTETITAAQACSAGATVTAYVTNYVTAQGAAASAYCSPPASILSVLESCLGSSGMSAMYTSAPYMAAGAGVGTTSFPIDTTAPPAFTTMLNNFVPGLTSVPASDMLTIHEVQTGGAAAGPVPTSIPISYNMPGYGAAVASTSGVSTFSIDVSAAPTFMTNTGALSPGLTSVPASEISIISDLTIVFTTVSAASTGA